MIPRTVVQRAPLSIRFPRQEYWNELPFTPPGDPPNTGIEPMSPELADSFLTTEPQGSPSCDMSVKNVITKQTKQSGFSSESHSLSPLASANKSES